MGLPLEDGKKDFHQYIANLRRRLQDAYKLAASEAEKAQLRQKRGYDQRLRGIALRPGDRVLVKILAFEGKHKLSNKFEDTPYVVTDQPNEDIPVFTVQREDGVGPLRTLHRNHLLPISTLPTKDVDNKGKGPTQPKPASKHPPRLTKRKTPVAEEPAAHTDSDASTEASDDEIVIILGPDGAEEDRDPEPHHDQPIEDEADAPVSDRESEGSVEAESVGTEGPEMEDADTEVSDRESEGSVEAESVATEGAEMEEADTEEAQAAPPLAPAQAAPPPALPQADPPLAPPQADPPLALPQAAPQPRPQAVPRPQPEPRRSGRTRKPPERLGNFVQNQCQHMGSREAAPAWAEKAKFLAALADSSAFANMSDDICHTILNVVSAN